MHHLIMLKLLHRKLDEMEWGYLFGLAIPVTALLIILKALRIAETDLGYGIWSYLDLFKSELFFGLGLSIFGVWTLKLIDSTWKRRLVLVGFQVATLMVLALEIGAHQFFMATGSTLDFFLMSFALENFTHNAQVIQSEVPTGFIVLASVTSVWLLLMPWLASWGVGKLRAPIEEEHDAALRLVVPVVAMVVVAASALPALSSRSNTMARTSSLNIAFSAAQALQDSMIAPDSAEPTALDATLEPASDQPVEQPRNLAVIILESTRARSTSVHNPDLDTTPFLEGLAATSTVAERAYAIVPHTSKALVAILCGHEPRLNMPITESAPGNIPAKCLAEMLGEQGYQTAYFQSAMAFFEGRTQLVKNMGYETFVPVDNMRKAGFEKADYLGWEDDIMLEPSRQWLANREDKPFYTTYLTFTPHHDYLAPDRYGFFDFDHDEEVNRYLNSVRYVDHFVKNLFDQYKKLGIYENTVFVIIGDHGEAFGEHGRRQHDNVIYEEGLRIPFMIHDPQNPQPRRIEPAVSQLDLLPTVADWLGYEITGGTYPGADMLELSEERPIRAHCWYERRCMAQIIGDEKFIHHFNSQPDEFYNLAEDPMERNDLASKRYGLDQWRRDLLKWRSRINGIYRHHAEESLGKFLHEEVPEIEHRVDAVFGDEVRLLGYDLNKDKVRRGESFTITYYFETIEEVPEGWMLFVHGEGSGPFQNLDHVPVGGLYPLHDWQPGQIIADQHEINVPIDWNPGQFHVLVGIWHKDKGRKPISGAIETMGDRRAKVATVQVE